MHAEAASLDELARQLRFADALGEETGVPVVTAMQTDVPGAPVGLVNLLANAGVRYLSVAHNYGGRAAPYLTGAQQLTRPFYWRSESGKRVLVWHTDSPHGVAYLEGNLLGLAESYESSLELLPEYLAALASRPYPYGQGIEALGIPPELELTRRPYPHDLLHLRVQGATADNAGPSLVPASVVRAWCSDWAYPELRLATNAEFFSEAEARLGAELETYSGDWTDWWADGLGSSARALAANRRAQATIRSAQTLHTLADALGADGPGERAGTWPGEVDRAYETMSLFDEHTWGAAEPGGDNLVGRSSGVLQWQAKAAMASNARDRSAALLESATSRLAQLVGTAPAAPTSPTAFASVAVFNPSSWARTDVVRVFVPSSRVPLDRVFSVQGAEGAPVAHAEERQAGPANRNRPQGRWTTFVAEDVPPLGYRRYVLVDGDVPASGGSEERDAVLENEHYRVELEPLEGCAVSVFDKALDRDLVDSESPFGFGQYVLDRYTSGLQASVRLAAGSTTSNASIDDGRESARGQALLRARSTAGHGVIVERVANAVEQRLTIRLVAEGAEWLETTYRLLHGIGRLEFQQRLAKLPLSDKESVYFVFPFAFGEPAVELELTGAVGGPAAPRVPGSAEHLAVLRHWISLRDSTATVTWAADEAALAHLGNIPLPYPPFPPTVEPSRPGTVVSWAMNNVWDTNFPLSQGGEATFTYALASAGAGADGRDLGRSTAAALTRPLVGVLGAARTPAGLGDSGSFCVLDRDDVEVVLLGASQRGHSFVVHLYSTATEAVEVSVAFPDLEVERVLAGTFLERELTDVTRDRGGRLRLGPGDYVALAVDLVAR